MEGMLLWVRADALIRERTDGAKSLDDFCKRFFAAVPGKKAVAGYDLGDVVQDLKATAEYDWEAFLRRRVEAPQEALPLDVLGRLGYRLKYADKPPGAGLRLAVPSPMTRPRTHWGSGSRAGWSGSVDPGAAGGQGRAGPGACG